MADIDIYTNERLGRSVLTAQTVIGRMFLRTSTQPTVNQETRVISHVENEELPSLRMAMNRAKVGYTESKQTD